METPTDNLLAIGQQAMNPDYILRTALAAQPLAVIVLTVEADGKIASRWSRMDRATFCVLKCELDAEVMSFMSVQSGNGGKA